jgi:predicted DNA-binding ribbon-helix-helix protein
VPDPASNIHSACAPQSERIARKEDDHMKSPIVKRSIVIGGHKTSVSLEDAFWRGLKEIAHGQRTTLSNMVAAIDKSRAQSNLSSAIRLFVLDRVRSQPPAFPVSQDGVGTGQSQMIGSPILTHA